MKEELKVTYYYRKPFEGNFSIEELFGLIQKSLPNTISYTVYKMKYYSKGFIKRFLNGFLAMFKQGTINHITGDINYIAFFLKKRKTILTIHDLEVLKRNKGLKYKIIKFFWFTVPCRRAKFVTVISESTRKDLLEEVNINAEKVKVVYDCISSEIEFCKKDFNAGKPRILHIGTKHNKNLENTIKALAGLNVQLLILGRLQTAQEQLLKDFNIDHKNFYNLDYKEVLNLYKESDLLSFVSISEGFGLPIIEANAIGRPVITSNTTSMPEIAGEAALIVDPFSVDEIRNGISEIIQDDKLRNSLIDKGKENVKRFLPEQIVKQYTHLYAKI